MIVPLSSKVPEVHTLKVAHLGITAGYRLSGQRVEPKKPTLVMINSECTTSALYDAQFESKTLTDAVNLLAIEPLGHGATTSEREHFTYWDSAVMALHVLDILEIEKAFALGTSQGGWIVVRMALLAPERILGVIPLGTSMDYESGDSRDKGCWDPKTQLAPLFEKLSSPKPTPEFVVDDVWTARVSDLGFGPDVSAKTADFWSSTLKDVYKGDEGRRKLRMALLCLMDRDGLLRRLRDVKCPVYWLQGPNDPVFGKTVAEEHIREFTQSPEATLTLVDGAGHYLNVTSPKETEEAILKMVKKHTPDTLPTEQAHGTGCQVI